MAATGTTTAKLVKLRPTCLSSTTSSFSIKFFSSSSTTPTEDPKEESSPHNNSTQPKSSSAFTSLLNDVKASIKQQQGNPQSRTSPKFPSLRPSFNLKSNDEVLRNLSEFRRRPDVTPPPASHGSATPPAHHISLSQMYQQSQASKGQESSSPSSGSTTLKSFLDTLSSTRSTNVNNSSARFPRNNDKLSLSRLRETLNSNSGETSGKHSTGLLGSGGNLPSSIFGKEMVEGDRASANADTRKDFVKRYSHADLGKKLESLRPDKKGDWFSLQELNDRLMKLRQIDKENPELERHSGTFAALRDSLQQIQVEKQTRPMPNINLLKDLGRTPSFMMSPPQEHLVEKYFHPDNMSASEKLKLELEKVRDEFKMSESDCGSARVQVAQLTTKIKHLATVLHKKDKHSRKGLLGMVQKRKTLLKYLRRTDWESYSFVLSKLGLRDNPDYKN